MTGGDKENGISRDKRVNVYTKEGDLGWVKVRKINQELIKNIF